MVHRRRHSESSFYIEIRQKNYRNSQFLRLPREVRELIYRAALVRPTPIDLWPNIFDCPNTINDPILQRRLAERKKPKDWRHTWEVRKQDDLTYVREQMATGLLGTCWVVYREAANLFWRENTFRFSGDYTWIGLRRFLMSIGDQAIARLETVEALMPTGGFHYRSHPYTINYPKVRMAKCGGQEDSENYWQHLKDNVTFVIRLLERLTALKELRLLVPADHYFQLDENPTWRDCNIPGSFLTSKFTDWVKVTAVLENGASINPWSWTAIPEEMNLLCLPGSNVPNFRGGPLQTVAEKVFVPWIFADPDLDILTGISSMFNELEEDEDQFIPHYRRKKKTKGGNQRVLKAFGGCKFIYCVGDCDRCRAWGVDICLKMKK